MSITGVAPENRHSPARWEGERVRMVDLADRGCTPGWGAAERLDPYWGGMWTQGSSALWVSQKLARTQERSGLARMPRSLDMSQAEARKAVRSSRHFGARLAALAAIDQWRTVSAEQLAALTGWEHLASPDPRSLVSLFALSVLDRGTFASALLPGAATARSTLYRPSRSDAFDRELAPILSWEQQVAVTGGRPWDFRRQFDRHNLLATELGLRVAQFCEVGTVVGEKLSTLDLLAGTGLGREEITAERAADLTIVRPDGLRIAVEITASAGPDFEEKVRRWARILQERPLATSGLTVLFLEAAPHDGDYRYGSGPSLRSQVYKAVARVVRQFPGTGADRVADRIGVVSWSQWFPAPQMVSRAFLALEVDRPSGPADDRWERAGLLDVVDTPLEPRDPRALTAIIDNAAGLLGTPHWLRDPDRAPALWPMLLEANDWTQLPVPPPTRATRFSGQRPDAARGVVGATRPGERMRIDSATRSAPVPDDDVTISAPAPAVQW